MRLSKDFFYTIKENVADEDSISGKLLVKSGMIKACEKRPVSIAQIDEMALDIEKQIQNSLRQEIPSQEIGEMIMQKLKAVDEIAYVRFASVYRQFKDVTNFIKLITEM